MHHKGRSHRQRCVLNSANVLSHHPCTTTQCPTQRDALQYATSHTSASVEQKMQPGKFMRLHVLRRKVVVPLGRGVQAQQQQVDCVSLHVLCKPLHDALLLCLLLLEVLANEIGWPRAWGEPWCHWV